MAVPLLPLVDRLKASLVNPGTTDSPFVFGAAQEDDWVGALANAFWQARMWRFFTDWRLNPSANAIIPGVEDGDEFPEELQQIIVLTAALTALENQLGTATTKFAVESGEEKFSTESSSNLLVALLKARRSDLEKLRDDLVSSPTTVARGIGVIDMALERAQGCFDVWLAA